MHLFRQPILAVRCVMISVEILSRLSMNIEAANQLIRLTSNRSIQGSNSANVSDLFSGILLEKASTLFLHSKNFRRRSFHLILAGHRYSQANQKQLALKCYNSAAAEYLDKGWQFAEDHILFTLSHGADDSRFQNDCVTKLVKPSDNRVLDEQTQTAFIDYYVKTLSKNGMKDSESIIPLLDSGSVKIIYGEYPEILETSENKKIINDEVITWEDLERISFHSTLGKSKPFLRECIIYSDGSTKNSAKKETPPHERFRVQFKLLNPLYSPLTLKNVKLAVHEVSFLNVLVKSGLDFLILLEWFVEFLTKAMILGCYER